MASQPLSEAPEMAPEMAEGDGGRAAVMLDPKSVPKESRAARRARERREEKARAKAAKSKARQKGGGPDTTKQLHASSRHIDGKPITAAGARFHRNLDISEQYYKDGGLSNWLESKRILEESEHLPHDVEREGHRLYGLAEVCVALGQITMATRHFTTSLAIAQRIGDNQGTAKNIAGMDNLRYKLFEKTQREGIEAADVAALTAGMLSWAATYKKTEVDLSREKAAKDDGKEKRGGKKALTATSGHGGSGEHGGAAGCVIDKNGVATLSPESKAAIAVLDWVSVEIANADHDGATEWVQLAADIRSTILTAAWAGGSSDACKGNFAEESVLVLNRMRTVIDDSRWISASTEEIEAEIEKGGMGAVVVELAYRHAALDAADSAALHGHAPADAMLTACGVLAMNVDKAAMLEAKAREAAGEPRPAPKDDDKSDLSQFYSGAKASTYESKEQRRARLAQMQEETAGIAEMAHGSGIARGTQSVGGTGAGPAPAPAADAGARSPPGVLIEGHPEARYNGVYRAVSEHRGWPVLRNSLGIFCYRYEPHDDWCLGPKHLPDEDLCSAKVCAPEGPLPVGKTKWRLTKLYSKGALATAEDQWIDWPLTVTIGVREEDVSNPSNQHSGAADSVVRLCERQAAAAQRGQQQGKRKGKKKGKKAKKDGLDMEEILAVQVTPPTPAMLLA